MTRDNTRGFTLIELMIVVAIVAIIAAIAYPSYQRSVLKSHRADVESMLTQDAQILERCYTQNFSYNNNCPTLTSASEHGYYSLTPAGGSISATAFVLTATAQGYQTKDTSCITFKLDNTGKKSAFSSGGTDNSSTCWGQ
ncbi:MAG TPA: type IV pilin protein [Gammaproteobacteria bacterium]|nr:type IV pilin protein [Gammaproteobacteria bacterium]